jgi:uncharacterized hydrophobic protein (TIGR00271 family)
MILQRVERLIDAGQAVRVSGDELLDSVLPDVGDRPAKTTAFWALLVCSSIIASIGVLQNSTATVIGAMVIAPLGTPIYGVAAALVAGVAVGPVARRLLLGIVVAIALGAACEIALLEVFPIDSNDQVLSRTSPSMPDLFVALATGTAGALALVRRDISPALPGVAIAISLVPPLSVAGICLSSGNADLALGALVLFGTNLVAIVGAGLVVFSAARIARPAEEQRVRSRRARTLLSVVAISIVVALAAGTGNALRLYADTQAVQRAAVDWASEHRGWDLESVERSGEQITVTFIGSGRRGERVDETEASLVKRLDDEGLTIVVQFLEGTTRTIDPDS